MAIEQLRNVAHDSLFTARDGEHNWELAHRILLPVLGPTKIGDMLPFMQDIGERLHLEWSVLPRSLFPLHYLDKFHRTRFKTNAWLMEQGKIRTSSSD